MSIEKKISEILRDDVPLTTKEVLILFAKEILEIVYQNMSSNIRINHKLMNEKLEQAIDEIIEESNVVKKQS